MSRRLDKARQNPPKRKPRGILTSYVQLTPESVREMRERFEAAQMDPVSFGFNAYDVRFREPSRWQRIKGWFRR